MVVAIVLLVILAKATWNISHKAAASAAKLQSAQAELNKLELREAELNSKVAKLSDDQGIEAEIRTKYHAVKEGESVAVIVVEPQTAHVAGGVSGTLATSTLGWWGRFLQFLSF